MFKRDIVVIGASAGGVTALVDFIKSLPDDHDCSIFIVLHLSPTYPSSMPAILTKAGLHKVEHPKDGETIKRGKIYVAPPDHHLLVEGAHIIVKKGPKENRFRPSIDALFRSAAYEYGQRVIGIVLSGLLNDGTSGLWSVKRRGGIAVVQEPDEAEYPSMPMSVLEYVEVDYVVPVFEMGPLVKKLTTLKPLKLPKLSAMEKKQLELEVTLTKKENGLEMGIMQLGELSPFTCPECHGVLMQLEEGKFIRFRCHTGHGFSASSLLAEVTKSIEAMMWSTMRGLEENTLLLKEMAQHFEKNGLDYAAAAFMKKADVMVERSRILHDLALLDELLSGEVEENNEPKLKQKRSSAAKLIKMPK